MCNKQQVETLYPYARTYHTSAFASLAVFHPDLDNLAERLFLHSPIHNLNFPTHDSQQSLSLLDDQVPIESQGFLRESNK